MTAIRPTSSRGEFTPARLIRAGAATVTTALLVLGGAIVTSSPANAASVSDTQGGFSFSADDANIPTGATVVSYDSGIGGFSPAIPATVTIGVNTYDVTGIGDGAFQNHTITAVTIPNTMLTIGDNAFRQNSLGTVVIPDSVVTIGESAFRNNSLTTLTLPANIPAISAHAFNNNSLSSVDLPDSIVTIGERAFQNNNLLSLTLPTSLTTIGDRAFFGNQLTTVVIPATVTSIGVRAFKQTDDITIPPIPPLTHVVFLGAAPTTFSALGSSNSLGDSPGPLVHYPSGFAAPGAAGGYLTPTWMGYNAIPNPIVTFEIAGHGTAIPPMDVGFNLPASAPADPSETNWAFAGWFTDATLTTAFDFAAPISADVTAFAGWDAVPMLANTGPLIPVLPFGALAALLLVAGIILLSRAHRPAL